MRVASRLIVLRTVVCVLLTWTAIDLLMPQLCDAENYTQSAVTPSDAGSPDDVRPDAGDCFCCSHTVDPVEFARTLASDEPVIVTSSVATRLMPGVARLVYHPPLAS